MIITLQRNGNILHPLNIEQFLHYTSHYLNEGKYQQEKKMSPTLCVKREEEDYEKRAC